MDGFDGQREQNFGIEVCLKESIQNELKYYHSTETLKRNEKRVLKSEKSRKKTSNMLLELMKIEGEVVQGFRHITSMGIVRADRGS